MFFIISVSCLYYYLARGELVESDDGDLVVGLDLVVVGLVGEGERQHALLLQVCLVNP